MPPIGEMDAGRIYEAIKGLKQPPVMVLAVAGTPCQDVAKLKTRREGVRGSESSKLFLWTTFLKELADAAIDDDWAVVSIGENVGAQDE